MSTQRLPYERAAIWDFFLPCGLFWLNCPVSSSELPAPSFSLRANPSSDSASQLFDISAFGLLALLRSSLGSLSAYIAFHAFD
jgi:hypothetical protein